MKLLVAFFCFVAACSASAIYLPKASISHQSIITELLQEISALEKQEGNLISVNINQYVDDVLKLVQLWIVKNSFDPLPVEDIEEGFSAKIGLITWHGEFILSKGWLQGLATIMRSGDATMNYEAQLLNLRLPLKFDVVNINYDYLAKIMNLGPTGGVEGKIKNLNIYIDITVDTKTMEIILQGFKITDAGKITIKFSGHPLVDWLTNILTGLATRILHGVAVNVVQNQVRELLENAIDQINNGLHSNQYYLH